MILITKTVRIAILALIVLVLITTPVLAAYSYYVNVQVQETNGSSYSYLSIIADIDNDYLADNGYISLTGLDTRVLSGNTELKHMLTDDKLLFVAPTVGANSTGNYKYTLDNTSDLSSFPIVVGYDGYITVADDADLELGDTFEIEWDGYIDTSAGADKNLVYKDGAFRTYVSAENEVAAEILIFPSVAAVNGGNDVVNNTNHTVNLPAGIAAGNLLLVSFACDANTAITFPGGWTQLFQTENDVEVTFGTWYRIADGGEGATITVTTANTQMTAHTSYRIVNYSGTPEVGTSVTGVSVNPDSPSLTPSWGADNTLWFSVCGYHDGRYAVTDYPTNYTDGRNDVSNDSDGCGVGTARRDLVAVSDDPSAFTIGFSRYWVANTVAVRPGHVTVTATNVTSGEHTVKVTADSIDLEISVDEAVAGDGYDTVALGGASVLDNANNWLLNQNNTVPYMEYYKHTTAIGGSSLKAWYQPISMIVGTNLDDREGTDVGETGTDEEDAVITWGTNPAGISATVGSLISSSQPEISPAEEGEAADIVPAGNIPGGGEVDTVALQNNPFYFIVEITADNTDFTEEQIWFALATLIILVGMALAIAKLSSHLLVAGIVGFALCGFSVAMGIYPWWTLIIFGFMLIGSLVMERKPVL